MKSISIPALVGGQAESWREFLAFARNYPNNWTLVGGQLIHLLAWERNQLGMRATTDIDTVIDIKSEPEARTGITGATTLATAGGQEAINHSEKLLVISEGFETVINRPKLVGALIIKSEAAANIDDQYRLRHLNDLVTLYDLYAVEDSYEKLTAREIRKIANGIGLVERSRERLSEVSKLTNSIARVRTGLNLT